MADEERCDACGGLGAVVVTEQTTDSNGYPINRQRDKTCDSCGGTGRK